MTTGRNAVKALVAASILPSMLLAAAPASFPPPPHGRLVTVPGTCASTTVFWVGHRLEDEHGREDPDSGSAITLANGVYGVDYAAVPSVDRSRRGDPVRTCLVSLPRHCPPGDQRGKVFRTTNLRTRESWALPDAEHECGGA